MARVRSLPLRRFREVRWLLGTVLVLLVLAALFPLIGMVTIQGERSDSWELLTVAAAVAAAVEEAGVEDPRPSLGDLSLARFSHGKVVKVMGNPGPLSEYWPWASRQAWEGAGRPSVVEAELGGRRVLVALWPTPGGGLVRVVRALPQVSISPWRRGFILLSLGLTFGAGALAWFLLGRVLAPYGELLEEARRFAAASQREAEDRFLVSTFRAALARLERSEAELRLRADELGELSAGLAHELRNTLATIQGYLRLLREGGVQERYLAALTSEAQAGQELLERFLTFARPVQLRPRCLPLEEVVSQVAQGVNSRFPQVKVEVVGSAVSIPADPLALRVVLENLLLNACEAACQEGEPRVHVSWDVGPSQVEIRVVDWGPGVPQELQERLFEPFVSSKPSGGLGLALARRLARLSGGDVVYEPGAAGTCFVVLWPREVRG